MRFIARRSPAVLFEIPESQQRLFIFYPPSLRQNMNSMRFFRTHHIYDADCYCAWPKVESSAAAAASLSRRHVEVVFWLLQHLLVLFFSFLYWLFFFFWSEVCSNDFTINSTRTASRFLGFGRMKQLSKPWDSWFEKNEIFSPKFNVTFTFVGFQCFLHAFPVIGNNTDRL